MPYFNPEDLDISPDEFLEECSHKERDEVFEILTEKYGYNLSSDNTNEEKARSESHRIFLKNLWVLHENWYSLSKEDAEIINILAKKVGAI